MLPIIKPELFDNVFYTIKAINTPTATMSYVDFQMTQPSANSNNSNNWATITPTVLQKNIKVKTLRINLTPMFNENNIKDIHYLYNYIKSEINKDYFKNITILGEQNRNNDTKLDINIKKTDQHFYRSITSKFANVANYIAANGRIGTAQWFVSNKNTYDYILTNIDHSVLTFQDSQLMIAAKPYLIDDLIEDDVILSGRKNSIEQPGTHCFILTDDQGNVEFNEIHSPHNKVLEMYYVIDSVGLQPQLQYFNINTRSLSYYRTKKLQKIELWTELNQ